MDKETIFIKTSKSPVYKFDWDKIIETNSLNTVLKFLMDYIEVTEECKNFEQLKPLLSRVDK